MQPGWGCVIEPKQNLTPKEPLCIFQRIKGKKKRMGPKNKHLRCLNYTSLLHVCYPKQPKKCKSSKVTSLPHVLIVSIFGIKEIFYFFVSFIVLANLI